MYASGNVELKKLSAGNHTLKTVDLSGYQRANTHTSGFLVNDRNLEMWLHESLMIIIVCLWFFFL